MTSSSFLPYTEYVRRKIPLVNTCTYAALFCHLIFVVCASDAHAAVPTWCEVMGTCPCLRALQIWWASTTNIPSIACL
jgi:hypothetical protein